MIIRLLLTAVAVMLIAQFLPGVQLAHGFGPAILLAVVLALLNALVKPLLIILTLPITIVSLGLFLLVINALIILFAAQLLDGFAVSGFWTALLFSLLLSVLQSILYPLLEKE